MSVHYKGTSSEIRKRGLTVPVRRIYSENGNKAELDAKAFESAMRHLKRVCNQEGVAKDLKRKGFFESKGQIRRRKKEEAVRRERKNRAMREW